MTKTNPPPKYVLKDPNSKILVPEDPQPLQAATQQDMWARAFLVADRMSPGLMEHFDIINEKLPAIPKDDQTIANTLALMIVAIFMNKQDIHTGHLQKAFDAAIHLSKPIIDASMSAPQNDPAA